MYPVTYEPRTPWKQIREWWLAVEVLSPSSRVYDRDFKRGAYLNLGVEEVWLVDPESATVEIWNEDDHKRIAGGLLVWRPKALRPDRIEIDLDQVFPRG